MSAPAPAPAPAQSPPLVLITGITGFLASHVLDAVLAAPESFRVRGTLRNESKGDELLQRLSEEDRKRVEFVVVQDTAKSGLAEAVKGVTYILHTASPYQLNVKDVRTDLLTPAVEGTLNILRHAAKEPSIKRIGITSSFAAVTDFSKGGPNRPGFTYKPSDWLPATEEDAIKTGGAGAFAYSVSKKLAEKAAWDFVEKERPSWDIVTFNPPMIYGPTKQPGVNRKNLNTSSATIYNLVSSQPTLPEDRLPLFCHARDVGEAHVRALSVPSAGAHRFLLYGGAFTWYDAVEYLHSTRPELRDRLPPLELPEGKERKDVDQLAKLDTALAQDLLGMIFKGWKETLDQSLDSLLELEKSPGWDA